MSDLISRQAAIGEVKKHYRAYDNDLLELITFDIERLPPAQPEYEPVTAEDFAKTMSETTVYSYMVWHSEALTLMERQGFVICKKTM